MHIYKNDSNIKSFGVILENSKNGASISKCVELEPIPDKTSLESDNILAIKSSINKAPECSFCNEHHTLENCLDFQAINVSERGRLLLQNELCFKCLSSSNPGHFAKSCDEHPPCPQCDKEHHSLMHGYNFKSLINKMQLCIWFKYMKVNQNGIRSKIVTPIF